MVRAPAAAALTVLLSGCGGAVGLPVQVSGGVAGSVDQVTLTDDAASATWSADRGEVVFVSLPAYSGSCPPRARARLDEGGGVVVTIDDGVDDRTCTADATRATVTVSGLTTRPRLLIVEEDLGGHTWLCLSRVAGRGSRCLAVTGPAS